jgi:hypothetical protein
MTGVRARRTYDKIQEQIDQSLRSDPAIAELIGAARSLRAEATNDPDGEGETAVLLAAMRLFRTQATKRSTDAAQSSIFGSRPMTTTSSSPIARDA